MIHTSAAQPAQQGGIMHHLGAIVRSYSEILFFNSVPVGFMFFLVTLFNPNVAASGVIAVLAAYAFARVIDMDAGFLESGFYTYNPLLSGLAVGYLFRLTPLTVFIVISAGILTLVLTIFLYNFFYMNFRLPVLSLPFAIIASITYLASSNYASLFANGFYSHWFPGVDLIFPLWAAGFFKSLGAIFFLPHIIPGIVLSLIILGCSRILFMLAVSGYYSGTLLTGLLTGSLDIAFSNIMHFNYILICMAVGGIFLVPSIRSYCLGLVAVMSSVIILKAMEVFWSSYGIPAFTIPFNMISLSFVYVLGVAGSPLIAKYIRSTPEETLDYYVSNTQRFQGMDHTISLPFTGCWRVWQGFDGKWTHQANWCYAYDFVIMDSSGKTHRSEGGELADYYAFGKNVLAPVRGRIVKVVATQQDNPIGTTDKASPWGNLVIIADERGFFVEISHFAKDSIKVYEGQWVEKGALLGKCGNSGYSPQPHIHVQVQVSESPGAVTLPFSFTNYMANDKFHSNNTPPEGAVVEPSTTDREMDDRLSFMLDDRFAYEIFRAGTKIDDLIIRVKMAQDGTFYFDSGKARLHFGKRDETFFIYNMYGSDPWLKVFFSAASRVPLFFRKNITWCDHIPVGIVTSVFKRELFRFLGAFNFKFSRVNSQMKFTDINKIEGTIRSKPAGLEIMTYAELDKNVGFRILRAGEIELRRKEDEKIRG